MHVGIGTLHCKPTGCMAASMVLEPKNVLCTFSAPVLSTTTENPGRNARFKNVYKTLAAAAMCCNPMGEISNKDVSLNGLEDKDQFILEMECRREVRPTDATTPLRKSLIPMSCQTGTKPLGVGAGGKKVPRSSVTKISRKTPKSAHRGVCTKRKLSARRVRRKYKPYRNYWRRNKTRRRRVRKRRPERPKLQNEAHSLIPFLLNKSGSRANAAKQSGDTAPPTVKSMQLISPVAAQQKTQQTTAGKRTLGTVQRVEKASRDSKSHQRSELLGGNNGSLDQTTNWSAEVDKHMEAHGCKLQELTNRLRKRLEFFRNPEAGQGADWPTEEELEAKIEELKISRLKLDKLMAARAKQKEEQLKRYLEAQRAQDEVLANSVVQIDGVLKLMEQQMRDSIVAECMLNLLPSRVNLS